MLQSMITKVLDRFQPIMNLVAIIDSVDATWFREVLKQYNPIEYADAESFTLDQKYCFVAKMRNEDYINLLRAIDELGYELKPETGEFSWIYDLIAKK